jgi:hypothetical protein
VREGGLEKDERRITGNEKERKEEMGEDIGQKRE